MANEAKYWILANKAAKKLGWLPETIFTQWAWETSHFTSHNLLENNNIAGQTWYEGCGHEKGSARPIKEGGYYIKYDDAAQGYVEFIQKNIKRYGNVSSATSVDAQIDLIAHDGWAADPNYAKGLKSLHQFNIKQGFYNLPRQDVSTPMWDKDILKKGQIGKLTILKPINLWKRDGNKLVFVRILKPNEVYRVYGKDELYGGQYNLGGTYVTDMKDYVQYETPSKELLEQAKVFYGE